MNVGLQAEPILNRSDLGWQSVPFVDVDAAMFVVGKLRVFEAVEKF